MRNIKRISGLAALFVLLTTYSLFGQIGSNVQVIGKVVDCISEQNIKDVKVSAKDLSRTYSTNEKGIYKFRVRSKIKELTFSHPDYESLNVSIENLAKTKTICLLPKKRKCDYLSDFNEASLRNKSFADGESFTSRSISYNVVPLYLDTNKPLSSNKVEIDDKQQAGGNKLDLHFRNGAVKFKLKKQAHIITFKAGDYGGISNISINGDLKILGRLSTSPGPGLQNGDKIGGVTVYRTGSRNKPGVWTFIGNIKEFSIGGQELWIDNVCIITKPTKPKCDILADFENQNIGSQYPLNNTFDSGGMKFRAVNSYPQASQNPLAFIDDTQRSGGTGNDIRIYGGLEAILPYTAQQITFNIYHKSPIFLLINGQAGQFDIITGGPNSIGGVSITRSPDMPGIWRLNGQIKSFSIHEDSKSPNTFWVDNFCIKQAPLPRTITGTITNCITGDPVVGTNVLVQGTTNGTVTDLDGSYTLTLPSGASNIITSYVGCNDKLVNTTGLLNPIDFCICESNLRLARVLVTDCDTNQPLVGANVTSTPSGNSTTTSANGFASMDISQNGETITVSYAGYTTEVEVVLSGTGDTLIPICLGNNCDLASDFDIDTDCNGTQLIYSGPTTIDPTSTYNWINYGVPGQPILASGTGIPSILSLDYLGPGTYDIMLEQTSPTCYDKYHTVVTVPVGLSTNYQTTDVLCSTDGNLQISASGGTAPYSVAFLAGTVPTTNFNSNITFDNLSPGNYAYAITDSDGCTTGIQSVVISYVGPTLSGLCSGFGGCGNGITTNFIFNLDQNQLPATSYTHSLYNKTNDYIVPGSVSTGSFGTNITVVNDDTQSGDDYGLIVLYNLPDFGSCRDTIGNWTVPRPNVVLESEIITPNGEDRCHIEQFVDIKIKASINQSANCVQNPVENFIVDIHGQTYDLQENQEVIISQVNGASLSYNIIYDPNGAACPKNGSITIPYKSNIEVELNTTNVTCYGADNGTATITTISGNGNRSYQWVQLSPSSITYTTSNYYIANLPPGDYRVYVLDGTVNCDESGASFDFTIEEPDPLGTPVIDMDNNNCGLSATIVDNSQGPFTFTWYRQEPNGSYTAIYSESASATGSQAYSEVPQDIPILVDFNYKVEVKDSHECASESAVELIEQPEFTPPREYELCMRWTTNDLQPITQPEQEIVRGDRPSIRATDISNSLQNQTEACITNSLNGIFENLNRFCALPDSISDVLTFTYNSSDYHHTLYYYDRAGNLVRTVAPKGVDPTYTDRSTLPYKHTFTTEYDFNSLNQTGYQTSPDGGETNFLYNDVGQLRYSQNSKQASTDPDENPLNQTRYAYTKYDPIGRIKEVGESILNSQPFDQTSLDASDVDFPTTNQSQQTYTFYSAPSGMLYINQDPQTYLDNRVSYAERININGDIVKVHFSYNPHGDVNWMAQEIVDIDTSWIAYEYDLISGNVLKVIYNEDQEDQFYHRYQYDEDNRLNIVETSTDEVVWHRDAQYKYYDHGPLEYTIIGHDTLQKMDYAYTLQGWIKSINDINRDNLSDVVGQEDGNIPADAFGLSLQYHAGDFTKSGSMFDSNISTGFEGVNGLYNGNISNYLYKNNYAVSTDPLASENYLVQRFEYDKLNRLRVSGFNGFDVFSSHYTYDANGNFEYLNRKGGILGQESMDVFEYNYESLTNKLTEVLDSQPDDTRYQEDIDSGQNLNNYDYDEIGNLIRDEQEGLALTWTLEGKLATVTAIPTGPNENNLVFSYDPFGNRVIKQMNDTLRSIYVRDIVGNMTSFKTRWDDLGSASFSKYTKDIALYGYSRLGLLDWRLNHIDLENERKINQRQFELKDYLATIKVTIKDTIDPFNKVTVSSLNENYPYGMRNFRRSMEVTFRYGFNGHENDIEIKGLNNHLSFNDYGYDPRLGLRWTKDPKWKILPSLSPYMFSLDNPILFQDPNGELAKIAIIIADKNAKYHFDDHVDALRAKGYKVLRAKTGEEAIQMMSDNSSSESPIENLILLSHGSPGGLSNTQGGGLYTEMELGDMVKTEWINAKMDQLDSNDSHFDFFEEWDQLDKQFETLPNGVKDQLKKNYKSTKGARTISDFNKAVTDGDITFKEVSVVLGGCNLSGHLELDDQDVFATEIAKAIKAEVFGSQGGTAPVKASTERTSAKTWIKTDKKGNRTDMKTDKIDITNPKK